ncbi:1-phosphofructokinase family hexose kinase [Nitrosococcus wardiae]|uniref:Phosphofructokinase n=1 Tax=Nitrosococcus wardiae TaxID=1814290 RepID=A0A4P7C1X9_9GAMM|nr:1-phosphofructokinase family hexose kinase [Nitrosococcus wardiae]QBQ55699.1 1-phosphofructokinase family hexose kinase [Nitrosococcus wardiae]
METVITITMNPSLDLSTEVEEMIPGRKLRTTALCREPGGGGINVARGIHALGGQVSALYTLGGPTGQTLKKLIEQAGIKHHPIPIERPTRENFSVLEKSSGHLFHLVSPGPELSQQEWQQCLDKIKQWKPPPTYLVASGSLPPGVPDNWYARLARIAKKQEMRLILDTSGAPLQAALEEGVYLVKPNQHEFQNLTGYSVDTPEEQAALTREFVEQGKAEVVILTLGEKGALLTTREEQQRAQPPEVKGISPVGAGDSFVAVITFNLARGRSLKDTLYYGVAAAAAALLTPGTELYRTEDIERLYQQMCREKN